MFKIYYTDPDTGFPHVSTVGDINPALKSAEYFRTLGMTFVCIASDYANMQGKPGAKMSGSEYVPQMLNP